MLASCRNEQNALSFFFFSEKHLRQLPNESLSNMSYKINTCFFTGQARRRLNKKNKQANKQRKTHTFSIFLQKVRDKVFGVVHVKHNEIQATYAALQTE